MPTNALWSLLEATGSSSPDRVYCTFEGEEITLGALLQTATKVGDELRQRGLRDGARVAVMLPNSLAHVYLIFGLLSAGAIYVPVNVRAKGPGLEHIIKQVTPDAIVAHACVTNTIGDASESAGWQGSPFALELLGSQSEISFLQALARQPQSASPNNGDLLAKNTVCISYTSGTTGPPKGVEITDHMLLGCARAVSEAIDVKSDDTLLLWEPFYHVGGHQVLILGVCEPVRLAILPRFSASNFWDDARRSQATTIHYLGGVLQILLRQPARGDDRDHSVRVAWGAGATTEAWIQFADRFGIELREVYGLTETSSINAINRDNRFGSMGTASNGFRIEIVDESGNLVPEGETGQIRISSTDQGLFTPGYFQNPDATAKLLPGDGWLYTGDAGHVDGDGFLYFDGRMTDNVRVRGENVSAWEVETVARTHPGIADCAMLGVTSDLGEQDIKLFVQTAEGADVSEQAIVDWCVQRLGSHQVPRYIEWVSEFQRTPSMRILKHALSTEINCWDRATHSRKAKA